MLNTPVVVRKARIAPLVQFLLLAGVVEAGNGLPRPPGGDLSGHRIELGGDGEVLGQLGAERLEITPTNPTPIPPVHPALQRLVADDWVARMAAPVAVCCRGTRRSLPPKRARPHFVRPDCREGATQRSLERSSGEPSIRRRTHGCHCSPRGPFIPWFKTGGFLAYFGNCSMSQSS
jgi:hypothetical protein